MTIVADRDRVSDGFRDGVGDVSREFVTPVTGRRAADSDGEQQSAIGLGLRRGLRLGLGLGFRFGLGLRVTPILADLPFLEPRSRIVTDLPDPAGNISVDFSGDVPAVDLIDDLQVADPSNPVPLCTWPGSLPFECYLTVDERARLNRSELVILVTPRVIDPGRGDVTVHEVQLISADDYVFSNGFESGDSSFW